MSLEFLIPYYILDINPVAQKCYISHTIAWYLLSFRFSNVKYF
jgi:hypothetical protein